MKPWGSESSGTWENRVNRARGLSRFWPVIVGAVVLSAGIGACGRWIDSADPVLTATTLAERGGLAERLRPNPQGFVEKEGRLALPEVRRDAKPGAGEGRVLDSTLDSQFAGGWSVGLGQSETYRVRLTPEGARLAPASVDDGRAVFRDVYPGVDAVVVAEPNRVELFYVLRDAEGPTEFAWGVELGKGIAVAKLEPSGSLLFSTNDGQALMRIPRPFAVDANGTRRELDWVWDSGRLAVETDTKGLEFPVLLDPAVETVAWEQKAPATAPSARGLAAMVYDDTRSQSVLFGGYTYNPTAADPNGLTLFRDTWRWDGVNWAQFVLPPMAPVPAARWAAVSAFDSARGRMVLFGGSPLPTLYFTVPAGTTPPAPIGDLWEWDGSAWQQRFFAGGPSARFGASMAYDSARRRIVLFGGQPRYSLQNGPNGTFTSEYLNDTWEWDGTTWTQRTFGPTPVVPEKRSAATMSFDSGRGKIVLFGGGDGNPSNLRYFGDTWELDGSGWTKVSSQGPSARWGASSAYDGRRRRTILYGGDMITTPRQVFSDTWEWDGTTWTRTSSASGPTPARYSHRLVFHQASGSAVLFGGSSNPATFGDTWTYHARGGVCASAATCNTGFCVDGVCCETLCGGGLSTDCQACSVDKGGSADGLCLAASAQTSCRGAADKCDQVENCDGVSTNCPNDALRPAGAAGAPTCSPYVCSGSSSACPGGCSTSASCAPGFSCVGGTCLIQGPNGTPCTSAAQCVSGNCVNGVCCNTSCADSCDFCNIAGSVGTCRNSVERVIGSPSCAPYMCSTTTPSCPRTCSVRADCWIFSFCENGKCIDKRTLGEPCTVNVGCTSNNCVDGVCCNTACSSPCDACNLTGSVGTCSNRPAGTIEIACLPYRCSGTSAICPSSCTSDSDCLPGNYYCNRTSSKCEPPQPIGKPCTAGNQCLTRFCVDGVCCSSACVGECNACTGPGVPISGACWTLPKGSFGSPSCSPFVCSGASATCPSRCAADADCRSGYYCNGGVCFLKLPDGSQCTNPVMCRSGNCIDGVCCNTSCPGECTSCSTGTCGLAAAGAIGKCQSNRCSGSSPNCPSTCTADAQCMPGLICSSGACRYPTGLGGACTSPAQCAAGLFCADGVCCNTACNGGPCDACSITAGAPANGTCALLGTSVVCRPSAGSCDSIERCTGASAACGGDAFLLAGSAGSPSCPTSVCSGSSPTCPAGCTSDTQCVAGRYCSGGSCVPRLTDGAACTSFRQCASGNCIDGVCCNTACAGQCDACNLAGKLGTCSLSASGSAGAPVCAPYLCSGASADCPRACTSDAQCVAGRFCQNGTCVPKNGNGFPCMAANSCVSNLCVDGVCCNSACLGSCNACNVTGAVGTCVTRPAGSAGAPSCNQYLCAGTSSDCPQSCTGNAQCAPGNSCAGGVCTGKKTNGNACTAADQCVSGFCADGVCCNSACSGQCDACNTAGSIGTCRNVAAGAPGSPSCGFYLCSGSSATCPQSCTSDAQCAAGRYCASGACTPRRTNGSTCTAARECASGNCVDGVCCNTACAGSCDACNLAGSIGTCANRPAGSSGSPSCGELLCQGGAACPSGCTADAQCSPGYFCSGGRCVIKPGAGGPCTAPTQCQSGFCADGVCCNAACSGQCDVCNASGSLGVCANLAAGAVGSPSCSPLVCSGSFGVCPATCTSDAGCIAGRYCAGGVCQPKLGSGSPCASGTQCLSGFCADGVCCNSACAGKCDACNLRASLGLCTIVAAGESGSPSCSPYVCSGSGPSCPGRCTSDTDCVAGRFCDAGSCLPKRTNGSGCTVATQCASGNCVDGVCCNSACAGACDACNLTGRAGTCSPNPAGSAGSPSCSPFVCSGNASACPESCSSDSACAAGHYCDPEDKCAPKLVPGADCTLGRQCASGNCVDGVCCNSACGGPCDACNLTGSRGTCTNRPAGAAGSPSCSPLLCPGSSPLCASGCTTDAQCVAGTYCSQGRCITKPGNGLPCTGSNQCSSGFCVDGVCCNAPCAGQCEACNLVDSVGACVTFDEGSSGSPSCAPYVCTGSSGACPSGCSSSAGCAPGRFCTPTGKCDPKKNNGSTCASATECLSGHCVDGVCCNAACAESCDSCAVAGRVGTCSNVAAGAAGGPSCAPALCSGVSPSCPERCTSDAGCAAGHYCDPAGECAKKLPTGEVGCTSGNACVSGFCVDGVCCDKACAGSCESCSLAGRIGACTARSAGSAGSPPCAPTVCGGTAPDCLSGCATDADCAPGNFCSNGKCVPKPGIGDPCTSSTQCASGSCVGGVCCSSACDGACEACNITGSLGTCVALPAGARGNPGCGAYLCTGASGDCPSDCLANADCAPGNHCAATGRCAPKLPLGAACTASGACASGNCVDGVCCNTSCAGPCDACNLLGSVGTCGNRPVGAAGTPSCSPFLCSGGSAACPGRCSADAQCAKGYFCSTAGACLPKRGNGEACSGAAECLSGDCVDGVCCDSACAGPCNACNLAFSLGTCTLLDRGEPASPPCGGFLCSGSAPGCPASCGSDDDCAPGYLCVSGACVIDPQNGKPCAAAKDCRSGNCIDGVCCDAPCAGSCDVCNLPGAVGACTPLAAGTRGVPSCSPYLCGGASGECPKGCRSSAECDTGQYCPSGSCVPKLALGGSCTSAADCASGRCVDGVCCNSSCQGECNVCNLAGSLGTCTRRPTGSPGSPACAPYLCSGTSATCPERCTSDAACSQGYFCNGSGVCEPKLPPAEPCTAASQCASGQCTDGVCCNSSCVGECNACDVPGSEGVCTTVPAGNQGLPSCAPFACTGSSAVCPGRCTTDRECEEGFQCTGVLCVADPSNGTRCTSGNQCKSGFCVDGVCCNTACAGPCDACNSPDAPGVCVNLAAGSTGSPACGTFVCTGRSGSCPKDCTSSADCASGLYCSAGSCVVKLANGSPCTQSLQCTSGKCVDGVCCNSLCAGPCDVCSASGKVGTCTSLVFGAAGRPPCAPFVCGGSSGACIDQCGGSAAACAPGFFCEANDCVPKKGPGDACTAPGDCVSGFCVDGVCCDAVCKGQCEACDTSDAPGVCSPSTLGSEGSPTCAPLACTGTSRGCPAQCSRKEECAPGHECVSGTCEPEKDLGTACGSAIDCPTRFCVDGVCCNSACSGACDVCNAVGFEGTCTPLDAGEAGSPTCAPYKCSGLSGKCPARCLSASDCVDKHFCSAGECKPLKPLGEACTTRTQCRSNECTDHVCCNARCDSNCEGCNQPGTEGVCVPLPKSHIGLPPCAPFVCLGSQTSCPSTCTSDAACAKGLFCDDSGDCVPKRPLGRTCTSASACVSGNCVDEVCCESACVDSCDACDLPGTVGQCVERPAGASGEPSCGAYRCGGAGTKCPASCVLDTQCALGFVCLGGNCQPRQLEGKTCTVASQCASGFCVDGVCCDRSCTDPCDVCNLPASRGKCTLLAPGSAGSPACAPYTCTGASALCPKGCSTHAACASDSFCESGGCVPKGVLGTACVAGAECQSGNCVDGVCCDTACAGPCDVCNVAGSAGKCTLLSSGRQGDPACAPFACSGSSADCPRSCTSDAACPPTHECKQGACVTRPKPVGTDCQTAVECASGLCVDGVCCDTACAGACEACSVPAGAPANGTCASLAKGTAGEPSCAPYACTGAGGACPTKCATEGECITGALCDQGACKGALAIGQACKAKEQCSSGFCADGVCCNSACAGACDACAAAAGASADGTCAMVAAGASGNPSCFPFVCDGKSSACQSICESTKDCAGGYSCNVNTCEPATDAGSPPGDGTAPTRNRCSCQAGGTAQGWAALVGLLLAIRAPWRNRRKKV